MSIVYFIIMLLFSCGNNGVYCFFIYLGVLLQGLVVKYVIFLKYSLAWKDLLLEYNLKR